MGKVGKEKKGYQEHMETFRGNRYVHYLDDGDGFTPLKSILLKKKNCIVYSILIIPQ